MEWFEEMGYEHSPFVTEPFGYEYDCLGRDEEINDLLYMIEADSMVLIKGVEGSGKTTLLREAIKRYGGKKKVLYIDCRKISRRYDINDKINKRDMVLLMDNVSFLSKRNSERIKHAYDEGRIKSAVFTYSSEPEFSASLKERIGTNIINLKKLDDDTVARIMEDRLDGEEIFDKDTIRMLNSGSRSIKEILLKAELLCSRLVPEGITKIDVDDIKKVKEVSDTQEDESGICNECSSVLEIINGNYLCPECDTYCKVCGTLLDMNDSRCEECGKGVDYDMV